MSDGRTWLENHMRESDLQEIRKRLNNDDLNQIKEIIRASAGTTEKPTGVFNNEAPRSKRRAVNGDITTNVETVPFSNRQEDTEENVAALIPILQRLAEIQGLFRKLDSDLKMPCILLINNTIKTFNYDK